MLTGACKKIREMDWQLVASYFNIKSTEFFTVYVYIFVCTVIKGIHTVFHYMPVDQTGIETATSLFNIMVLH